MTTKKIKWRLGELPTPDEVRELVKDDILTKDEAREILFSQEDIKEVDKKALESEIKFLRELVQELSKSSRSTIVETIKYIEKPYQRWGWYQPYKYYCGSISGQQSVANALTGAIRGSQTLLPNSAPGAFNYTTTQTADFKDIKTF